MKTFSVFTSLGVIGLLGFCAQGEVVDLTYRVCAPGSNELVNIESVSCPLQNQAPEDARDLPKFNAQPPCFCRVFGNRLAVLDKSSPDAKSWDTLWLDGKGDGKLQSFTFKPEERGGPGQLSVIVPVEFPGDDGPTIEHFNFQYYAAGGAPKNLRVTSACYYFGAATFGDKSYSIALVDNNANGRFDDEWKEGKPGDLILIDFDHKGHFDNYGPDYKDAVYVSKAIYVNGRYWDTKVAPDGSSIAIAPSQVATGKLQANAADLTITVAGDSGRFTLRRTKADEPFLLPMGKYRLDSAVVAREDGQGQLWVLRGVRQGGDETTFEIKPDATAQINVGAPLSAVATASPAPTVFVSAWPTSSSTRSVTDTSTKLFSLSLTGTDGLSYQIYLGRDGMQQPPAPELQLKSKDGAIARIFTFSYG